MSPRLVLVLTICLICAATGTIAWANDPEDRWQVTTKMDLGGIRLPNMPGGPPGFDMPTPPAHVQEVCTPRRPDAAPVADRDGRCKVSDVQRSGNRQSVHLDCGPHSMGGTLELVYDSPDHYVGHMVMTPDRSDARNRMPAGAVTMVMEGRRIGMCDSGDAQQQSRHETKSQGEPRDACTQSALAAEFVAFLGEHPRCQDRTAVQTFCGAVQDFEGFLHAATQEADAVAPGAAQAASGAIDRPLTLASRLCDFKIPDVRLGLCNRAESLGKLDFLLGQCAAQAQSLAQRICPPTAGPGTAAADFCARYQAQGARIGENQGQIPYKNGSTSR